MCILQILLLLALQFRTRIPTKKGGRGRRGQRRPAQGGRKAVATARPRDRRDIEARRQAEIAAMNKLSPGRMKVEATESTNTKNFAVSKNLFCLSVSTRSSKSSAVQGRSTGKMGTETGKAERVEDAEGDPRRMIV